MSARRIVFLTTGLLQGGAESVLFDLTRRLDRSQFDPVVVSLRADGPMRGKIEAQGVTVHSPNMNPALPSPFAWRRLGQILQRLRPALIQGWMYHGNLAAAWAARELGSIPYFFSIHNSIYDLRKEKFLTSLVIRAGAMLSRKCAGVVYCAHTTAAQHEAIGYDSDKTRVVHNGFDLHTFVPLPASAHSLRSELGVSSDTALVGLIARWDPHKDHENFFAAARIMADAQPNVQFVLAGKGVEYSNPVVQEMLERHRLSEHVHLLGARSDIPRIMGSLDLLVSSSSSEAFPIVVGEAMSCGVPCCVTDVGDSRVLVGDSGRSVPRANPQALAAAALELLNLPAADLQQLGAAARRRIENQFSVDTMVQNYSRLYDSALAGGF
jgi:glycosyltransferase involved in cell wall biosynthesis